MFARRSFLALLAGGLALTSGIRAEAEPFAAVPAPVSGAGQRPARDAVPPAQSQPREMQYWYYHRRPNGGWGWRRRRYWAWRRRRYWAWRRHRHWAWRRRYGYW
jgi:hypothetical protein